MNRFKLSSLGEVVTGTTPPARNPEWFGVVGETPFITPTDVKEGQRSVTTLRFLSDSGKSSLSNRLIPAGSVCFVSIGSTIGKMCLTLEASVTNQQINSLVVDQRIANSTYIYYALMGRKQFLRSIAGGSATPILNKQSFSSFEIEVLPKEQQDLVGEFLDLIDFKIESNRRIVDLATEMSIALLSNGEERIVVGQVAELSKGLSYKGEGLSSPEVESAIPMFNLANFSISGQLASSGMKFYKGEFKNKHLVKSWDLLISNTDLTQQREILGRGFIVPEGFSSSIHTHHTSRLRFLSRPELLLPLWAQLQGSRFRERAMGFATGTTVTALPPEAILEFEMIVPNELTEFLPVAKSLIELSWKLNNENRRLIEMRENLLPGLISGKIHVQDVMN